MKIIKASDPVVIEQCVVCIYGAPGVAKTSLGFTAEASLLLDFDQTVHRALYRKDAVRPASWADVASMTAEDFAGYRTVVIDTVGRALDMLADSIIAADPKRGKDGALDLKGFGILKSRFIGWLRKLRSFGLDVVLIAHMEEKGSGDDIQERIDAQGGSKNEVYKVSDAMGRLAIRDGKRVLLFSPTETAFGKNPAEWAPLLVPRFDPDSTFLGDLIRDLKAHLNAMSEEQREVSQLLSDWSEKVHGSTGAKSLNELLTKIDGLDARIQKTAKGVLWRFAKDHGFSYDDRKGFTEQPAAKVA